VRVARGLSYRSGCALPIVVIVVASVSLVGAVRRRS
jgi:hypothetical protein